MNRRIASWKVIWSSAALWLLTWVIAPSVPTPALAASHPLLGGAYGVVKSAKGQLLEGMMLQLISHDSAIRTTVFSDSSGRYEFPKLQAGWYTFRIARPLYYRPYQRESVWIEDAPQLEEIVLDRVTDSEFLPPTPAILAQLSDSEWLYNLPGTGQEKKVFANTCGSGCHTWQQSLRNRFDEKSWAILVDRMTNYGSRLVLKRGALGDGASEEGSVRTNEMITKFLARVRGPDSEFPAMKAFPRPRGAATRVIITEYEFPRFDVRPHDVVGDAEGNIWYNSNRNPIMGKLDPRTGAVKEYRVPIITPGKHTGQHWMDIRKDGKIVFTESWSGNFGWFDPRTGEFRKVERKDRGGNAGLAPDGSIWKGCKVFFICQLDPETALPLKEFRMKKASRTYGAFVSADGNYFAGGTPYQYDSPEDFDGIVFIDIRTGEVIEAETESGAADPSRGGFDPEGNAWAGGRGGVLVQFERKTRQVKEYYPPTPYLTFYEAKPDKNGEVWSGAQRGARMIRFNPKADRWIEYQFPEAISLDWRTWVDNSTNPVTVWYGEHNGYLVRIQPLE